MDADELMRRTEEQDREQYLAELVERDLCESRDAIEAYWAGVMAAQPSYMRDVIWDSGPG